MKPVFFIIASCVLAALGLVSLFCLALQDFFQHGAFYGFFSYNKSKKPLFYCCCQINN